MTDDERRQGAAINRYYAALCMETYLRTGRPSALYMAQVHEACARRKEGAIGK